MSAQAVSTFLAYFSAKVRDRSAKTSIENHLFRQRNQFFPFDIILTRWIGFISRDFCFTARMSGMPSLSLLGVACCVVHCSAAFEKNNTETTN
jgi:hypothetical protein